MEKNIFNGIPLQLNYILPSEVDFKADFHHIFFISP